MKEARLKRLYAMGFPFMALGKRRNSCGVNRSVLVSDEMLGGLDGKGVARGHFVLRR